MSSARESASEFKGWMTDVVRLFAFDGDSIKIVAEVAEVAGTSMCMIVSACPTDTSRIIGRGAEMVKSFRSLVQNFAVVNGVSRAWVQVNENRGVIEKFSSFAGNPEWPRDDILALIARGYALALGEQADVKIIEQHGAPEWRTHVGVTVDPGLCGDAVEVTHSAMRTIFNVIGKTQGMQLMLYVSSDGSFEIQRV